MKKAKSKRCALRATCTSNSIEDTMAFGEDLASGLREGDIVALIGDLGAGKTVVTKGLAKGLGVKDARYVNSPTFVIIKEYKGKLPLYHFDLYRLDHSTALDAMDFEEHFYGRGVCVIEWADKIMPILPKKRIEVRIAVTGENKRIISTKKIT